MLWRRKGVAPFAWNPKAAPVVASLSRFRLGRLDKSGKWGWLSRRTASDPHQPRKLCRLWVSRTNRNCIRPPHSPAYTCAAHHASTGQASHLPRPLSWSPWADSFAPSPPNAIPSVVQQSRHLVRRLVLLSLAQVDRCLENIGLVVDAIVDQNLAAGISPSLSSLLKVVADILLLRSLC